MNTLLQLGRVGAELGERGEREPDVARCAGRGAERDERDRRPVNLVDNSIVV